LLEGIANTGGVAESGGNKYFEVGGPESVGGIIIYAAVLCIADVEVIGDILAVCINGQLSMFECRKIVSG
jgi:hypothetical protein